MQITITKEPKGNYSVRSGDRYQDELCWDEMLGVVARATMLSEQMERVLRTADEHARSSYSSIGTERRREASYDALCGINIRTIRLANELFGSNVEKRLIYLLSAVQNADEPLIDPPEAAPETAPVAWHAGIPIVPDAVAAEPPPAMPRDAREETAEELPQAAKPPS